VGQGFFHLVHQHQAQVARLQARQGGVDGDELATDFFDVPGARRACQAFAQQAITSPSARPRWAASWYRITSSNAAPRITVCSRMSSSRRSPAPLMTTLRRLPGRASTACTRARMASGLWP
jgi:hypothetical protein